MEYTTFGLPKSRSSSKGSHAWWDWKGILYYELLPNNQRVNSEKYCSRLDELRTTIEQRRSELANRKGVAFHWDNSLRGHMYLWLLDKSCWSLVGICYTIHRIHQTLHPQIITYLDNYRIPLMAKILTFSRHEQSHWKVHVEKFSPKNLREFRRMEYSSYVKYRERLQKKIDTCIIQ